MIPLFKVFMSPEAAPQATEVLNSGYIGQGSQVDIFENQLASLFETKKRVITTNSCTSALDLSYRLIGLRPGDTVISTPMTCVATNFPLYNNQINIIWADVDPQTGLIDVNDVKNKMTNKVKAIICVDWCGCPCDYNSLRQFDVPIVEDAAHALLTRYDNQHIANSGGDYVCWSFQAIKYLTCGDGGALVVPKEQEAQAIKMRWYGFDRTQTASFRCDQDTTGLGFKYHMNDISAAIGLSNIPYVKTNVNRQIWNAKKYTEEIKNTRVSCPMFCENSSYWIFTILVDNKKEFIDYMVAKSIEVSPVHRRNDVYSIFRDFAIHLPQLDEFFARQVAIPVGWWLSNADLEYIIAAINGW